MIAKNDSSDIKWNEHLKLYKAVESSGESIYITDPQGNITYVNPGFTNLYGYTSGERW